MQFDADHTTPYTIAEYSPTGFTINKTLYQSSILLGFDGQIHPWHIKNYRIAENDLAALASLNYDILLIGTGWQQYFPPTAWLAPFLAQQKAVEIMNTPAACRTYNILATEYRQVCAALFLPSNLQQTPQTPFDTA